MSRFKKHHKWAVTAAAVSIVATSAVAVPVTTSNVQKTVAGTAVCHIRGALPDPVCTPGVANPNVTQANLSSTICVSGFTKTIRPPASVTGPEKLQSIKQYGYGDTNPRSYEYDHLISLELGGAPNDLKNLWAEPGASPNAKDKVENQLHSEVCAGTITLAQAQSEISTDWLTAK